MQLKDVFRWEEIIEPCIACQIYLGQLSRRQMQLDLPKSIQPAINLAAIPPTITYKTWVWKKTYVSLLKYNRDQMCHCSDRDMPGNRMNPTGFSGEKRETEIGNGGDT